MGNDRGWMVGLVVIGALLAGCGDEEDAAPAAWDFCERTESGCTCEMRAGGSTQDFPPADDCSGYDCCLLHRSATSSTASCRCFDTTSSCEDEAGDSATFMIVQQCPPPGELLSSRAMCIPEGEQCPNRQLGSDSEASGCCEGLFCLSDDKSPASDVCQPAGDRDPVQAQQCERATLLGREELEVVSGTLATDRGELKLDSARSTVASVGPGCLLQLNMAFTAASEGDAGSCELVVDAILFEGEWVVRRALGSLEGCEGYSGSESGSFDVREAAEIPFGFSREVSSCGARHKYDENCVVGTYDWHFTGELGGIDFEGSHLVAEGVVCASGGKDTCDEISASP